MSNGAGTNGALLTIDNVVAGYVPEVDILSGVTINVKEGEIVTIVGPNGAGKSTLIKTVFGLLSPRSGQITFRNEEISGLKPHECTQRGLSYVPQLDNVFPTLTVEENLEMGSLDHSKTHEQMDRMYALFPRLGERKTQPAGTMSGGERQMVAMGRALMLEPKLLMLDEPTAGLSPLYMDQIFERIVAVNRSGVGVLLVEQNAKQALAIGHTGYVLATGRNRFTDSAANLLANREVAESFLGG